MSNLRRILVTSASMESADCRGVGADVFFMCSRMASGEDRDDQSIENVPLDSSYVASKPPRRNLSKMYRAACDASYAGLPGEKHGNDHVHVDAYHRLPGFSACNLFIRSMRSMHILYKSLYVSWLIFARSMRRLHRASTVSNMVDCLTLSRGINLHRENLAAHNARCPWHGTQP